MYDDYDTRLQADASKFNVQEGNTVIEIFDDDVVSEPAYMWQTSKVKSDKPSQRRTGSRNLLRLNETYPRGRRPR
jgi:hypothetical protein